MRLGETISDLFPLALIDFEASSLDRTSFPIEVGVAIAQHAGGPIHVWSTIIAPDPAWNVREAWDPDAERIHGISRGDLMHGLSSAAALTHLNALLGPTHTVWCGDGKYDPFWLEKLVSAAAPLAPIFGLRGVAELIGNDKRDRDRLADLLAATTPPHRAGPDAERLCRALITWLSEPET